MLKLYFITFISLVLIKSSTGQVFPNPSGMSGSSNEKKKEIDKCSAHATTTWKSFKFNTSARRYQYELAFWNECYQITGREKGTLFSPCTEQPECNPGWNKAGRISFMRYNSSNKHKLHVGWRADENNMNQLKLSAYFHEVPDGSISYSEDDELQDYYVSHYITNINTDRNFWVDMYMSLGTIALKLNNYSVVIRKPGMIPSEKDSYIARSFYFGKDIDPHCFTPESMAIRFRHQWHDKDNYILSLNNSEKITVNITSFISRDSEIFHAYNEIWGSVPNSWATNTYVQYHSDHPNQIRQMCIIESGADITFESGGSIKLYPGFHAKPGSNFKARIVQKAKNDSLTYNPQIANLPPLDDYLNNADYTDDITLNHESVSIGPGSDKRLDFIIYPNPTSGIFNIEAEGSLSSGYALEVINMMGNTVFSETNVYKTMSQIDISAYPKGIYLVKLSCGEYIYTEKLVYR